MKPFWRAVILLWLILLTVGFLWLTVGFLYRPEQTLSESLTKNAEFSEIRQASSLTMENTKNLS